MRLPRIAVARAAERRAIVDNYASRGMGHFRQALRSLTASLFAASLILVSGSARADTFRTGTTCWYGVCEQTSPANMCAVYAAARVTYSQNNSSDSNKWVFYDSLAGKTNLGMNAYGAGVGAAGGMGAAQ